MLSSKTSKPRFSFCLYMDIDMVKLLSLHLVANSYLGKTVLFQTKVKQKPPETNRVNGAIMIQ